VADKSFRTILHQIAFSHSSPAIVFADFCRMAACSLAMLSRDEEYLEVIRPYSKEQLQEFSKALALLIREMESQPFADILGPYYLEVASHSSKQVRGEFYTPPEVSELMARISIDPRQVIEKGLPITVNEPACGAGGMVLAIAKLFSPHNLKCEKSYVDFLRVTCQDINPVAMDMCFINTSLWGIPARMVWGNTLHNTVNRSWKNIHWHRVGEDERIKTKALFEMFRAMEDSQTKPEGERRSAKAPSQNADEIQVEFDLDLGACAERSR